MADTYDPLLRIRLQETGGNRDTWGGLLNTDALNLLAKAIAGKVQVTVADSNVTLTTNSGSEDEARYAILDLIGSPAAAREIIIPASSKLYVVRNATGQTMTIKTATGAGVAVSNGVTTFMMCDGTNVTEIKAAASSSSPNADALGGVPAAEWARLNAAQAFEKAQKFKPVPLSMAATTNIDLSLGNVFTGTLNANTTIAAPSNYDTDNAQIFFIHLQQASSGGPYTLAFNAFFDFLGSTPSMPVGAGDSILLQCVWLPGLSKAICYSIESSSSGGSVGLTFTANEKNVDLFRRLGSPGASATFDITIAPGVIIHSDSTSEAALDLSGGFPAGSIINIYNYGFIIGKGGRGADGGWVHDSGDSDSAYGSAYSGEAGGPAIRNAGAGITVNIYNASGRIWGGGGGGGAGGCSTNDGGISASAGGGGGAGMGPGGKGARGKRRGNTNAVAATDGANGRLNLNGSAAGGAAGTSSTGGSGYAGASGAGGDYGQAGTNGASSTTGTSMQLAATAGGAAGKAIDLNGGSVTLVSGATSPNVKGSVS